ENERLQEYCASPLRLHGLPLAAKDDKADDQRDHAGAVEDQDDREQVVVDLVGNLALREATVTARMGAVGGERDENEQPHQGECRERRLGRAWKLPDQMRCRLPVARLDDRRGSGVSARGSSARGRRRSRRAPPRRTAPWRAAARLRSPTAGTARATP